MDGILGFLGGMAIKFILGWLSDKRAEKTLRESGRLESERDQATAGLQKQQELSEVGARWESEDEVIGRLSKGKG